MRRQASSPCTAEDWDVLNFATLYHVARHGFEFTNQLDRVALAADRRDADLMLTAQRMRGLGFDLPIQTPSLLGLGWISAGGGSGSMRLPSVWFTAEDLEAWGLVCLRFKPAGPCWWYEKTRESDRRDAARMLFQMQLRDKLTPRGNYIRWMDLHPAADWRAECL